MRHLNQRFNFNEGDKQYAHAYLRAAMQEILGNEVAEIKNLDIVEKLANWMLTGRKSSLLITGTVGCGKSVLAKALAKTLAARNNCPYFVRMWQLVAMTRRAEELPEFISEKRILFLDDIGTEPLEVRMYGNSYPLLNEILFCRYDQKLPTIMTTNLTLVQLQERYGDRVASRLKEMCDVLVIKGGDLRQ